MLFAAPKFITNLSTKKQASRAQTKSTTPPCSAAEASGAPLVVDVYVDRGQHGAQLQVNFVVAESLPMQVKAERKNPLVGHEFSAWQNMVSFAAKRENCEFNKVAQAMFLGYTPSMREMFFAPSTPADWFKLPRVQRVAEAFMAEQGSPLTAVPKIEQIALLNTPQQYRVAAPEAHAKAFDVLKRKYGSSYVFHGSLRTNWQQILFQGLEPKSGTAMMASGARNGNGVYVATHSALSKDFVDRDGGPAIMGVAEIVHHPLVVRYGKAYLVPEKVCVLLRFVATYPAFAAIPDIVATSLPKPPAAGAL